MSFKPLFFFSALLITLVAPTFVLSTASAQAPAKKASSKKSAPAKKSARKKKAPAQRQVAWSAKCKNMTPQIWKANFDGCMNAFKPGIQAKQITLAKSRGICACVADGLVKESTCQEIDRFHKDKAFEQQMTGSLAQKCLPKN